MSIVDFRSVSRPFILLGLVLVVGFGGTRLADAHPVSQGSMDITIARDRVTLRARVSTEEVFVRNAYVMGAPGAKPPGDLTQVWQDHAQYLLRHVRVLADGHPLDGHVVTIGVPPEPGSGQPDRLTCDFEYPLDPAHPPAAVRIEEDVLNEFNYAPGNRWEASYVVSIGQAGQIPSEGRLLTSRDPLEAPCVWPAAGQETAAVAAAPHAGLDHWRLFREYVHHGIMHILTGYDHLLFISALALATLTFWDLVKVISAFTLAHSVTLTLATLNIVRLPSHIVEPMISASIVFVALQNVLNPRNSRGKARLAAAFFFGLFHGLGFAGGLMDAMEALPGVAIWLALAGFSLGVELGHQVVVLPLFFGLRWARGSHHDAAGQAWISRLAMRYGSALIAVAGSYYLVIALRGGE